MTAAKKDKMKLPAEIRLHIISAVNGARCNTANFNDVHKKTLVYDRQEWATDDFIKSRIRLHHESWVIKPLMHVLAWDEGVSKIEDFREPQGVARYNNAQYTALGEVPQATHPLSRHIVVDMAHDAETQAVIGIRQILSDLSHAQKLRVLEYLEARERDERQV